MGLSITVRSKGSFKNTENFFERMIHRHYAKVLAKYGEKGVQLLAANTPVDTGETAASWVYEVIDDNNGLSVVWSNTNVKKGWANVALLLQYGHATGTGGYVRGIDYINPALKPVFDELAEAAWTEVKNS